VLSYLCLFFTQLLQSKSRLSATLPNAHRLAAWMESVTGRKSVLIEAGGARPVPLRYYFATRREFAPLFRDEDAGPGAPHGLLGLRGDGVVMTPKLAKKKKIGKQASLELQGINGSNGLPEGLQLHPIIQKTTERRMASIDRRIQRLVQQQSYDVNNFGSYSQQPIGAREQRKMKEQMLKAEMKKSVPSISTLIEQLVENELLPAIFFIFSRKGCDNAAEVLCNSFKSREENKENLKQQINGKKKRGRFLKSKGRGRGRRHSNNDGWELNDDELAMIQDEDGRNFRADLLDQLLSDEFDAAFDDDASVVSGAGDDSLLSERNLLYYSEIGLLNTDEVRKVAARVIAFNEGNPEIAFDDMVVEQFLCGVGSHHAGILPAHKAFVETLFRLELMKAVFATETLAAGISKLCYVHTL
jgi:superfamily II RNA helicase